VVADLRHRLSYVEQRPKDWRAFFAHAAADSVLAPGRALVADLSQSHEIVWLSGRPENLRNVTIDWLRRNDFPTEEVHLRPNRDFRPASHFKLEVLRVLQERDIAAFIDDDSTVIDAAINAGFPAVLADWLPRGAALRDAQDRLGRT